MEERSITVKIIILCLIVFGLGYYGTAMYVERDIIIAHIEYTYSLLMYISLISLGVTIFLGIIIDKYHKLYFEEKKKNEQFKKLHNAKEIVKITTLNKN